MTGARWASRGRRVFLAAAISMAMALFLLPFFLGFHLQDTLEDRLYRFHMPFRTIPDRWALAQEILRPIDGNLTASADLLHSLQSVVGSIPKEDDITSTGGSLSWRDALQVLKYRVPSKSPRRSLQALALEARRLHDRKGFEVKLIYGYKLNNTQSLKSVWVDYSLAKVVDDPVAGDVMSNILRHDLSQQVPLPTDLSELSSSRVFVYNQSIGSPCFKRAISLKYTPACAPDHRLANQFIRQVLITAVQRSGTHFTWEMLNRLGIDVHHEGVGKFGAVSWLYAVNAHSTSVRGRTQTVDHADRYVINNPEKLSAHRFRFIFHQVRHPLRVITTLVRQCAEFDYIWRWLAELRYLSLECSAEQSPLERAMRLYLVWNRHIELYADIRFVAESTSPRDICRWAGFEESTCSQVMLQPHSEEQNDAKNRTQSHRAALQNRIDSLHRKFLWRNPHRRGNASLSQDIIDRLHKSIGVLSSSKRRSHSTDRRSTEDTTSNGRDSPSRRLESAVAHASSDTNLRVTWDHLDAENRILADEIRLMCLEYGMPLDPAQLPQRADTFDFRAR